MVRVGIFAGMALLAACSGGPALIERGAERDAGQFDARAILVLTDADMAGTAYADGRLVPLQGARDGLTILAADGTTLSATEVSNSVMAWPGALDVSPDGRFAYIVETRAAAPEGATAFDDVDAGMPEGRLLSAIDFSNLSTPRVIGTIDVGRQPTSVQVSPDGRYALVSRKEIDAPLALVSLENGVPMRVTPLAFPLSIAAQNANDVGAPYVRLAPNGRDFVVNVANTHVQFGRLVLDANGAPVAAVAIGDALPAGRWISMIRWSVDGRHIIVADVAWGPSQFAAVLNGPGALVSIAFDPNGTHRVVSRADVSLSPEGFEINRDGDLLVAVNMERTYLPERLPYTLFGRRAQASLSLVSFDARTGALRTVDGPLGFNAVLPEDAVFDADGDMLAVAVYQGRDETADAGSIEYFRIDRSGGGPRLIPTGRRTSTARGAHDLLALAP